MRIGFREKRLHAPIMRNMFACNDRVALGDARSSLHRGMLASYILVT